MSTKVEFETPECHKCIYTYIGWCPCGNSLHNSACLEIFKNVDRWSNIFEDIRISLKGYDASHPKMDELIFVQDICDKNKITRKEAR